MDALKIKLDAGAFMPERAHADDAGLDLFAPEECYISLFPTCRAKINTGVHVAVPRGHVGKIEAKSSLMETYGILTSGTIDSGYTGSIHVMLFNAGQETLKIVPGQKIAQLVIYPIITPQVVEVDKLDETERGDGGFGSTGAMAKEATGNGEV